MYEQAKRFDLLNEMFLADGDLEKALHLTQNQDRINLKTTHYKIA
jgi:hypothetical protein